jgi:hypothetical protein
MLRDADWLLCVRMSTGYTCLSLTTNSKRISQSYRYFAKPYWGLDVVKCLAERARSAL